jgi:hypothetical protein
VPTTEKPPLLPAVTYFFTTILADGRLAVLRDHGVIDLEALPAPKCKTVN